MSGVYGPCCLELVGKYNIFYEHIEVKLTLTRVMQRNTNTLVIKKKKKKLTRVYQLKVYFLFGVNTYLSGEVGVAFSS